jgi:hypothetical protein
MKALYFMKRLRRNLKQKENAELFPRDREMGCCAVLPSCSKRKIEYSVLPLKDRIPHVQSMVHRRRPIAKRNYGVLRCLRLESASIKLLRSNWRRESGGCRLMLKQVFLGSGRLAVTTTPWCSSATIGTKVTATPLVSGTALFETTTASVVRAATTTIISGSSVC